MTAIDVNPGLLMIAAGLLACLLPRVGRQLLTLGTPVAGLLLLIATPMGALTTLPIFGYDLTLLRVGLSFWDHFVDCCVFERNLCAASR